MEAVIQAFLGVVQGLFGFLWSIVLGFFEGVLGPMLAVAGAPKTLPPQLVAVFHSAAYVIDTLIPMSYFQAGLSAVFLAYCLKWGTELMLLPLSIAKWVANKVGSAVGTAVTWAARILAWFV